MKIGINGFGSTLIESYHQGTGRLCVRQAIGRKDVQIVHINDPNLEAEQMAYLLKFDTTHGRFNGTVSSSNGKLLVDGVEITVTKFTTPAEINWHVGEKVEYVIESSGKFLSLEQTRPHLASGPKKVVVAAPSPDEEEFGIVEGFMTTIHAMTGTQMIIDSPCARDRRRGRSAMSNISPTSTGAAKSVGKVIPSLLGKMTGIAFRVPTTDMCVVDLTVKLKTSTSYDAIVEAVKRYALKDDLKGFLDWTEDEIVSSDVIGNTASCLFDVKAGIGLNDTFFKLICWTDNESAYSARMLDLIQFMDSKN